MQNTLLKLKQPTSPFSIDRTTNLLHDDAFITKAAELVITAKQSIKICAYAWRWYENAPEKDIQKFNYQIAKRANSGLDIQAILNSKTEADYLKQYGIKTKTFPSDRVLHTKAILIDEKILIIGSHNLTERANTTNYEISVVVSEKSLCLDFLDYFNKMWRGYGVH